MGDKVTVRLDTTTTDALDTMEDDGDASDRSDALRTALNRGLGELGYRNGVKKETWLRAVTRRTADAFALLGVFWVGLTFFYPLGLRAFAIPIFMIALALYVTDRAIAAYEPTVSRRLVGFLRGEKA